MNEWILIITLAGGIDGGMFVKDVYSFTKEDCVAAANSWNNEWYSRRIEKWTSSYVKASGFAICVRKK